MWTNIKQFWLHFFEIYKHHKCLWDVNAVEYMNTAKRKAAYEELINLAKTVNSDADKHFVRSRINNARTAFRKEVRKLAQATENGTVYKPKLFYYDLLHSFLSNENDQENAIDFDFKETYCNFSEDEDTFEIPESIESELISSSQQIETDLNNEEDRKDIAYSKKPTENVQNRKCGFYQKQEDYGKDEILEQKPDTSFRVKNNITKRPLKRAKLSNNEEITDDVNQRSVHDECDILGKRLAIHFRNMRPDQRLLAEKIISDVCIYARMDQLNLRSGFAIDLPADFNNFPQQRNSEQIYCLNLNDEEVVLAPDAYMQVL